ncbi:hypothetical protein SKC41_21955 [Mycobacterium sp. 050128]|uniref:hypothetical protein n=1 Tax=Mycobacterium sp. 050128 TaxID=3096112 RepID=UPI002ED837B9
MADATADAVVIGAGHHGLVAASMLADAGRLGARCLRTQRGPRRARGRWGDRLAAPSARQRPSSAG